ncbi:inorganic phosphate transporter, partial [Rhodococcus sp. IEGM 1401]
ELGVSNQGPDQPLFRQSQATASSVLYVASIGLGAPVSTTHVISSAIMGVGATKRTTAVRWGTAGDMFAAWVTTLPAAAVVAALNYVVAGVIL